MTDEERTKLENALKANEEGWEPMCWHRDILAKAYREALALLAAEDKPDTLEAIAHAQGIDSPQADILGAVPDLDISDDAVDTPSVPMAMLEEIGEKIDWTRWHSANVGDASAIVARYGYTISEED